jgi:hypothetical protein
MQQAQHGRWLRSGSDSGPATLAGWRAALGAAAPFLAASVAFALYVATIAPDLSWANRAADGGELITAAATLGVAHPPGYPLYILAGKLFSALPVGTVAFRLNLLSAAGLSLAVCLLAVTGSRLSPAKGRKAAAAAALLFAVTPLVWGQALVAEVYALNAALVAATLLLLLTTRRPGLSGFFLGLAVLGHSTSLLLLPLALYKTPRRQWPRFAAAMAAGLAPALLLPFFAAGDSPVVWGEIASIAGWWDHITAGIYRANLGHWPGSAHWEGLRSDLSANVLPVVLVGAGLFVAARAARPSPVLPAAVPATPAAALVFTFGLYALFALAYDTPDAAVLLMPGLMILALLLSAALPRLGISALLAPVLLAALFFGRMDLSHDRAVRPVAESLLRDAPAAAVVLTPGDRTIFTLWYFHHVEGHRPDIVLVDQNLFAFDWYRDRLAALNPGLLVPRADDLAAFRAANAGKRPICEAVLRPAEPPTYTLTCTD